nr:retrovirus-related Pol polyprotein from transposon TNT 1-94 [Tanacetum cinerariifolium]
MIAPSNSRISSKNMPRFTSNDMVHNHYLEEAKKSTQECSRTLEPSLMHSARLQSIVNGSKPMPRRNTQTSRNRRVSKNSFVMTKIVPIAERPRNSKNDSCVTKFLKEGFKEFSSDVQEMTSDHNSSKLRLHDHNNKQSSSKLVPDVVPQAVKTATSQQVLELLFHHHITMLRKTKIIKDENNNDQAEEGEQLQDDEFTNPFCAPTQEDAESSSHNIDNSNIPTFNQPQVWELVDKPFGKSIIWLKWLWKNKKDEYQTVIRNKARLVAKGTQVFSNFSDGRENDISQWSTEGGDGFVNPDHPEKVYRLKKALYGLKQAPKAGYDELSKFLISKGFTKGIQFLGDKLVSWMSKKQNCTAMSSVEVEYVALSASCAQVMWMRTQLQDYGFNYNKIPLYCNSQSAIVISCNPVQHSRTKHIHTRYHFIKEQVKNCIIELYFVRTEYQLADMFIKSLPEDRFKYLVRRIGMRCLTPTELEVLAKEFA